MRPGLCLQLPPRFLDHAGHITRTPWIQTLTPPAPRPEQSPGLNFIWSRGRWGEVAPAHSSTRDK